MQSSAAFVADHTADLARVETNLTQVMDGHISTLSEHVQAVTTQAASRKADTQQAVDTLAAQMGELFSGFVREQHARESRDADTLTAAAQSLAERIESDKNHTTQRLQAGVTATTHFGDSHAPELAVIASDMTTATAERTAEAEAVSVSATNTADIVCGHLQASGESAAKAVAAAGTTAQQRNAVVRDIAADAAQAAASGAEEVEGRTQALSRNAATLAEGAVQANGTQTRLLSSLAMAAGGVSDALQAGLNDMGGLATALVEQVRVALQGHRAGSVTVEGRRANGGSGSGM